MYCGDVSTQTQVHVRPQKTSAKVRANHIWLYIVEHCVNQYSGPLSYYIKLIIQMLLYYYTLIIRFIHLCQGERKPLSVCYYSTWQCIFVHCAYLCIRPFLLYLCIYFFIQSLLKFFFLNPEPTLLWHIRILSVFESTHVLRHWSQKRIDGRGQRKEQKLLK